MLSSIIGTIKGYFSIISGAIVLGVLAYIKYLKVSNENQKENIERLKNEIAVTKEVHKDEKKRIVFEAMQKERAIKLKENEITLDKLESEVKKHEIDITINDDFATSSV